MAEVIRMPRMSDTMEEGVIAAWHKKVGDKVKSGELMADVETDKATMELESYVDGTLLYIGPKQGESVKVNGVLAIVGKDGEDYKALLDEAGSGDDAPAADKPKEEKPEDKKAEKTPEKEEKPVEERKDEKAEAPKPPEAPKEEPKPTAEEKPKEGTSRLKASPLARNIAEEKGIDLNAVKGSGDDGRIVKRDIENFKPEAAKPAPTVQAAAPRPNVIGEESFEEIPVSQMRKAIARRLSESMFGAPHFYLTMEINMDRAMEARESMNQISPAKISFNDIVIKAVTAALRAHPKVNSSWLGDKIRINHHIHIGVAVAVEEGLLVPVIRFADSKTLSHIASEVKELAGKAKDKKLKPEEMQGNTFTISNLGMFGIEEFTAIINPPDACILAVGGIKEVPVLRNGQLANTHVMKITLSCDHRVVDGAMGAQFLQTLKGLLEDPVRILV